MDTRTLRLVQAIDAYMKEPPPNVPSQLMEQITSTHEMLSAPRYSQESPGEQEAREVAEASMPPELFKEMYEDSEGAGEAAPALS